MHCACCGKQGINGFVNFSYEKKAVLITAFCFLYWGNFYFAALIASSERQMVAFFLAAVLAL